MEVLLGRESNWRSAPFASGEAVMPQGGVTTGWWYEPAMNSKMANSVWRRLRHVYRQIS